MYGVPLEMGTWSGSETREGFGLVDCYLLCEVDRLLGSGGGGCRRRCSGLLQVHTYLRTNMFTYYY